MKIHLDTDIGGDIDDLCALTMLLRWPGIEITGITTAAEEHGRRAGYARYVLELAGRADIPLAAGADATIGGYRSLPDYPPESDMWPVAISPQPTLLLDALNLLKHSIESHAVIVGIGPYTNFRLLDQQYPGLLQQASLVLMGGYIAPPKPGFPAWGPHMDYNIQVDTLSAGYVLEHSSPLLVPLTVTVETALRQSYISRLQHCGPLGQLVALQAMAFTALQMRDEDYGATCERLPDDFINFQHDPLACAVALGWDGVTIETHPLVWEMRGSWLIQRVDPTGKPLRIVTSIQADRFNTFWLDTVASLNI